MKTIHLLCNPIAGKGNSQACLEKIKTWAATQKDLDLKIHLTENVGHATIITRDLTTTDQPITIFVIGGDGTLNEVLNGINNFKMTTIGILPYGSGNDFARALGIVNLEPESIIQAYINNPQTKKVDYLILNDRYRAINAVGLGMSASVIAYRNKMRHFSPATQYKIATILKSFFWKSYTYQISIDKSPLSEIRSVWFTINNGITCGSGVITSTDAKIDDGLITVSFIKKFNRIKTFPVLAKVKKGKIEKLKETGKFTCKELDMKVDGVDVEFDGNLLEHQNHVNVKIVPGELNILVIQK